jgi:hypothetical protein
LSDSEYWQGSTTDASSGEISWTPIPGPTGYPKPSAIYGAGDALFVGAASGDNYAVYALKDSDAVAEFSGPLRAGMLLGAAKLGDDYYVSLDGQGVFKFDDTNDILDSNLIGDSTGKGNFTGLLTIEDEDVLLMVSTSGYICKLSSSDTAITDGNSRSLGFTFTGAIAVWNDPTATPGDTSNRQLLLGRKGSNTDYNGYGYYECPIGDLSSGISELSVIDPVETVESNATYRNSLGKRAVNSLYYQSTDGVIFASTQQDSLWACRGGVWNHQ